MQPRSTSLLHKASGVSVQTPLLIPSFSSKGFAVLNDGKSEVGKILLTASEFLTGVYLISAYDVYYGNVHKPAQLPMKPELIVLDSGGYEISDDHDLSTVHRTQVGAKDWSSDKLRSVLQDWPAELPTILVSYDHPKERIPFGEQVAAAQKLFKGLPEQLHCFLLRPESEAQHTLGAAIKAAIANAEELRCFDVVGVTEKEIGDSPLQRMVHLARLRRALDEAGVRSPIHVFGALDPLSVSLYYIAGAEIFDGLSWLRYAFYTDEDRDKRQDRCVYVHEQAALHYGLGFNDKAVRLRLMTENYYYLLGLQRRMKDFAHTSDFGKLPHPEFLKAASDTFASELSEGGH